MVRRLAIGMTMAMVCGDALGQRDEPVSPMPEMNYFDLTAEDPSRGTVIGGICTFAFDVGTAPVTVNFDNDGYLAGAPAGTCNAAAAVEMQNDGWLVWTAPADLIVQATATPLESYDIIMAAYKGTCANLQPFACSNLAGITPSILTLQVSAGETIYFQIGDAGVIEGGGMTEFELTVIGVPNDACDDATEITAPANFLFDNRTAVANGMPAPDCNTASATLMQNAQWFRWTPEADYRATLTLTEQTPYDMIVQIYEGFSCGSLNTFVCGDEPEPISVTFIVERGRTYWFQCGDWGLSPGGGLTEFDLSLEVLNDTCATATPITVPTTVFADTRPANSDGPPGACNSGGAPTMDNDVWYEWVAPYDGNVTLMVTELTSHDIVGQVLSGTCGALTPVLCFDQPEPIVETFDVVGGETYFFQIGDWGTSDLGGLIEMTLEFNYTNEDCDSAEPLLGAPLVVDFGNLGADDGGPPGSCNRDAPPAPDKQNDLWWRWVAPVNGEVTVTVDDGNIWQSIISVFRGNCASLTEIGCAFNDGTMPSVTFNVFRNQVFYFHVGDWGIFQGGGPGTLMLDYSTPSNDDCANARTIFEGVNYGHNMNATDDGTMLCGSNDTIPNADVWFTYTSPFDGWLEISTCGTHDRFGEDTGMDTVLGIHSGCPGTVANMLECNDDNLTCMDEGLTRDSYILMPVTFGQSVTIQVAQFQNRREGSFFLNLDAIPVCEGDANGDFMVNFADLDIILDNWDTIQTPGTNGDVSGDGKVNFADLDILLDLWGKVCTF